MAVQAIAKDAKLKIKYLGEIKNEKQTYITKTYSNVNPQAADQDVYDVSDVISNLQTKTVHNVTKTSDSELVEA